MEDPENSREMLQRTAVAIVGGAIIAAAPDMAPVVVAVTPLAEAVTGAIGRMRRSREEKAADTLALAVDASGDSPTEFIAKVTGDDRRIELTTRTLLIGMDAALQDKRRALGRALVAGIAGDDARIDDELLFIRAVADIDTPHIKLLARLAAEPASHDGWQLGYWDGSTIQAQIPELGDSWRSLLATLELHGLVQTVESSTPWQGSRVAYRITIRGQQMLDRLSGEG